MTQMYIMSTRFMHVYYCLNTVTYSSTVHDIHIYTKKADIVIKKTPLDAHLSFPHYKRLHTVSNNRVNHPHNNYAYYTQIMTLVRQPYPSTSIEDLK